MATNPHFPSTPPDALPTLTDVAHLIKSGKIKNICILAGAGISTSAGIPDFRSPKTGLYANLKTYNLSCYLPYPEAIFDISYFVRKPQPFYTLAKELYPGQFKPTKTHYFFRLLQDRDLLLTLFTQNIDTLERIAGIHPDKLVEAHGSFASAECLECRTVYTKEEIQPQVMRGEIVRCSRASCKGKRGALVKPVITFFGEAMPKRFFQRMPDLASADLLLVLGTSLTVHPFASLTDEVKATCPRVLINLEEVGNFRPSRTGRDVRHLGGCDEAVELLVEALGWQEDFEMLVRGDKGMEPKEEKDGEVKKIEEKKDEITELVEELATVQLEEQNVKGGEDKTRDGVPAAAEEKETEAAAVEGKERL